MANPFPSLDLRLDDDDRNPAVQLFGRRFFADQTVPELLVELLLVASSPKRIGQGPILGEDRILPDLSTLRAWPSDSALHYAPKARLNLKLFAFLGASKLETRHPTHRQQYRRLIEALRDPARVAVSGSVGIDEVLHTLENLFLGFQGVGGGRTWCAQSFLPVSRELLAAESTWEAKRAKASLVTTWDDALNQFSQTQRIFLARGGELLYLQVCNALRQDPECIQAWCEQAGAGVTRDETNPQHLHRSFEELIRHLLDGQCPAAVSGLADFIDTGLDATTAKHTDTERGTPRFSPCGWCPAESWPEGLLFAVEILRLCQAAIDPIERLELMEVACALQVLRSLCAQSARHANWDQTRTECAGPLAFVWSLSDPDGLDTVSKEISRRCVKSVQQMIYRAVRAPEIQDQVELQRSADEVRGLSPKDPYPEADRRYGHKLFLTISKRIGLVVPKRGAGARFVLNGTLLRFLIMALIRPGDRVTYDEFKQRLFSHYGMAVDDESIGNACQWTGTRRLTTLGGEADGWLVQMLEAGGALLRLSDACALVQNPFGGQGESR